MNTFVKFAWLFLVVLVLAVGGAFVWRNGSMQSTQARRAKIKFYQDSMHPWVKSDQPGKCTICGMDLTPICDGEKGFLVGENLVVLASNSITVLNVQAGAVKRQSLNRTLRVAGTLEANEAKKIIIASPAPARIEALNVAYAGEEVVKGQTLATLFSPELIQKRGYFHAASGDPLSSSPFNLYSGSLVAPQSGTVLERFVSVGQYVTEGERLLTIADVSVLWFRFDVYEQQLAWIAPGQSIDITLQAVPGRTFPAIISSIEPALDNATRTIKVRADLNNPLVSTNANAPRLLKFGMYAEGRMRTAIPDVLSVPRAAVIFPGEAAYVYVDKGNGVYERCRITLGRQGDELWEVLHGLTEGDRVVTAGNVLIDAQAQFNQEHQPDVLDADEAAAKVLAPALSTFDAATNIPEPALSNKILSHVEMDKARMALRDKMWNQRQALIAGGGAMMAPATNMQAASVMPADSPGQVSPAARPSSADGVRAYREGDKARRAISAEMRAIRNTAFAGAQGKQTAMATELAAGQRQAVLELITKTDAISRTLAADDVGQFDLYFAQLPAVLLTLQKELAGSDRWEVLIQRLVASTQGPPAKDLDQARKQFLPFSTTMVELVGQLRKDDQSFADLKIYHCPMAPPPGVWIQVHGPLLNPYYGSKMLTCGEEVKP